MLAKSYEILERLRLSNGLYVASPSTDYNYVWIRDSVFMSFPYIDKPCDTYERTYWRLLDMLREYEWKLDIHTVQKPRHLYEYIHARYSAHDVREMPGEWGHAQHDAIGALLFGIGSGIRAGKRILRDERDYGIVRKLVAYLTCCEYWRDPDNGMWEEWREVHTSSVGACVAGLIAVSGIVDVPTYVIANGLRTLDELLPRESFDKRADLAQLSLIYPYNILAPDMAATVVENVERYLLRERGVIRYEGDSYYSTLEAEYGRNHPREFYYGTEAEWTFGLPWLALCHRAIGNEDKAAEYVKRTEAVMLADGALPELYYAGTARANPNTPLGWSSAMFILAKEGARVYAR